MDFDRLTTARAAVERAAATAVTLALNLFEDTGFKGVIVRTAPTASGYSLSGHLEDVPLGTVSLVMNGGTVAGSVRTPSATYTIRSAGDGHVEIRQVDPSTLPPGAEPVAPTPYQSDSFRRKSAVLDHDDEAVIDVLVLWTPAAKEEAGGRAAIEALIDLYVVETNQAYQDSGVQQAIHLVHKEEIDYVEDEDDVSVDLLRLADPDGYMDSVPGLGDRTGADLVNLVVASGPGFCGIAIGGTLEGDKLVLGGESSSFSVVRHDCHAGTFAHELGHNMGLQHDRYLERNWEFKPYPYAHGYVNQAAFASDAVDTQRWYTIMAYPDHCVSAGFVCTPLLRFSNPDQSHLKDPLGVPGDVETWELNGPADARRALNNTRNLIAALRPPRPVLTVKASASDIELNAAESFSLHAEVRNGGRLASEPTRLSFRRSDDAVISLNDTQFGTAEIAAIGATAGHIESVAVTAPSEGGNYYYGACLDTEQAPSACSEAVHVTVGPTVSIAPARVTEGENLAFSVSLSEARASPVTVRWEAVSETAAPAVDYAVEGERTVTIAAGETAGTLLLPTVADGVAEPDDTVTVALIDVTPSAPDGVVLSAVARRATGTIVNDAGDLPRPDAALRNALEVALGKVEGYAIIPADLTELTVLDWGYTKRV
ncbi:MAG: M12 family metallo-peptidase, partial [Gammaproteobacteria bacterium]|nr:M12 family metallo-peptidase [Gammaproteobacteria bacterium]